MADEVEYEGHDDVEIDARLRLTVENWTSK